MQRVGRRIQQLGLYSCWRALVWRRHGLGKRIAMADGLREGEKMAAARERMDAADRGR
jgi:hypothetical protein